jgi:uncharacterized membrane protein
VIVALRPPPVATNSVAASAQSTQAGGPIAGKVGYEQLQPVLAQRCYMCHGAQVQMKNVRLDLPDQVKLHAQEIYQNAVITKIMPMNNATQITDAERALIGKWFTDGAQTP